MYWCERLAAAARGAGIALATNHVCGMFGFFFTAERDVDRYAKVMACDVERFKRFFHGMLEEGMYFAPSAFEAGFLSAAHSRGRHRRDHCGRGARLRQLAIAAAASGIARCAPSPGSWASILLAGLIGALHRLSRLSS